MESVIEKLWLNELDGWQTSEVEHELIGRLSDKHKELEKTLNAEQKALFAAFNELWNEYASASEREMFIHAFRLGMQLALEGTATQD